MRLGRRLAATLLAVAALATAALAIGSCGASLFSASRHTSAPAPSPAAGGPGGTAGPSARASTTPSPSVPPGLKQVGGQRVCMLACHYVGVALAHPADLAPFVTATGVRPQIVQIYQAFGSAFPVAWASELAAHSQLPMIQVNPYKAPLAAIAAGQYDSYLRQYAAKLRHFGRPVAVSFAHEMNGSWYPWGCRHTSAATYVAAFRHVTHVIRRAGAHNVIWVWTANVAAPGDCPIAARYPGDRYVTWVGIDGYMRKPGRTFANIFAASLTQVRHLTQRPILLAETGVLVGVPGDAWRIRNLFRGTAAAAHVIGLVYFDAETAKFGDYRPQDNQATLTAFRHAVARYRQGH